MKTLRIGATIIITFICLCACGNAGARNEKKKDATASEKSVVELTSESFNAKIYDTSKEGSEYLGDKPAIVDFTAAWCGPCKMLARNVFTKAPVADFFNENFINVKDDMEKGEGIKLKDQFGVTAFPTLLWIDGDGNVVRHYNLRQANDKKGFLIIF